ncbi:Nuclear transport factor 2 (NTF2) domain protein [Mycobacterium basiliense]|uniref:Nuclear transport factor 2 (NTF2) domain protein n=1 Tax=Mycobacterium basiliense TaxID=2094119 RepID=A0A447GBJ0_9MYCO|nr:Nuclear transport factor 2 (NTF2) domain protein [Mycobacterium basiliense]
MVRPRLYTEVQQFYARQMRLLDSHDITSHAQTFTEDATFEHIPGGGPVATRAAIEKSLLKWDGKHRDTIQRRHWLSMIDVVSLRADVIEASAYLIEINVRPGTKPTIAQSCVIEDELTRVHGQLLVRSRKVLEDQL